MHTLAVLFALAICAAQTPQASVVPSASSRLFAADTVRESRIQVRPRFDAGGFFSPTRGVGAGLGVGVANLGWRGSDITIDAIAQQRYQDATVVVLGADPDATRTFVRIAGHATSTSRRRYFGIGPFGEEANEIFLNHTAADAELSVGNFVFDNTGLLVQPSVRFLFDRVRSVNAASSVGISALDPASQDAVAPLIGEGRHALSVGLTLQSDTRNSRKIPTSGSVFSLEGRYLSATDGSGFTGTRIDAGVAAYQPVGPRTVLIGRANLVTLDSGVEAIPFYYLPGLRDELTEIYPPERRVGRDALILGGAIQQALFEIPGYYGVRAVLMASVGQTYNNIWSEFAPAVTFEADTPMRSDGRAALQPAVGIGLALAKLSTQRMSLSGLAGFGPSGLRLATLSVAYDLRSTRPVHR